MSVRNDNNKSIIGLPNIRMYVCTSWVCRISLRGSEIMIILLCIVCVTFQECLLCGIESSLGGSQNGSDGTVKQ